MADRSPWRILALAAALSGCSTVEVRAYHDPAAEYSRFRSYAWMATASSMKQAVSIHDPRVRTLVVEAVDRELAGRALARTTPDAAPDLFVSVMGSPGNQGSLLLDIVDARTRKLVWRAEAMRILETAGELQPAVDDAVSRMLEGYPPRAP